MVNQTLADPLPPARSGLLYSLDFARAVPCPMLFLPPHPPPRGVCPLPSPPPGSQPDWEHPEGRQTCPAVPGTSQEALAVGCGLWAVGCVWQASGAPFLVSLGGNSRSALGRGECWCGRQTCEGGGSSAVQPPGQATLPPAPSLVTSGFLPDRPPALPFSAEQPEGSGTPLPAWWGARMPQRLQRAAQRCLRR